MIAVVTAALVLTASPTEPPSVEPVEAAFAMWASAELDQTLGSVACFTSGPVVCYGLATDGEVMAATGSGSPLAFTLLDGAAPMPLTTVALAREAELAARDCIETLGSLHIAIIQSELELGVGTTLAETQDICGIARDELEVEDSSIADELSNCIYEVTFGLLRAELDWEDDGVVEPGKFDDVGLFVDANGPVLASLIEGGSGTCDDGLSWE